MSYKKAGSGDDGTSSLYDGSRISKDNQIFEALGTVDELNAFIGSLDVIWPWQDLKDGIKLRELLFEIQQRLIDLGSHVATPRIPNLSSQSLLSEEREKKENIKHHNTAWNNNHISIIEENIKIYDAILPRLTKFILPNGISASFSVIRTVCRRLERRLISLPTGSIDISAIKFINRLSDLFFVLERYSIHIWKGGKEIEYCKTKVQYQNTL